MMQRIFVARHRITACTAALATALCAATAGAQTYPTRPVHLVASEAGGGGDIIARVIGQGLTPKLGQQVVVDNRGGGVIAGDLVAKAAPDGYTLLIYGDTLWLLPLMRARVPYDVVKDFAPITITSRAIAVLVVHPSVPVKSVKDLIALAKSKPGQLNFSSAAAGSTNHLAAELFKSMANVNIVRIPFKGSPSAQNAVMTGETHMMFPLIATAMPQIQAGRLKALAVTSLQPTALAPGLPTMAASGLPGFEAVGNYGLFAPTGTPQAIITRLNQETNAVLSRPEVKERFFTLGLEAVGTTPEELASTIKRGLTAMGKVIKDAGIRDE